MELDSLISDLESKKLDAIWRSKLIISLKETNLFVGNNDVKNSIALSIRHLIRQIHNNRDVSNMINFALYGGPGCGKTTLAKLIANCICYTGGLLGKEKLSRYRAPPTTITNSNIVSPYKRSYDKNKVIILTIAMIVIIAVIIVVINDRDNENKAIYISVGIAIICAIIVTILIEMNIIDPNDYTTSSINFPSTRTRDINHINAPNPEDCYILIKREDIVGKYIGHTEAKLKSILNKNMGKVVIIDEFYNLDGGSSKDYGGQALGIINTYMSEHAGRIAFAFLGYKDRMINGPFSIQPGLRRRCLWHFEMANPTAEDLFIIFAMKVDNEIESNSVDKIRDIISDNYSSFPGLGGDMETLAFSSRMFQTRRVGNSDNYNINIDDVRQAISHLNTNNGTFDNDKSPNSLQDIIDKLL